MKSLRVPPFTVWGWGCHGHNSLPNDEVALMAWFTSCVTVNLGVKLYLHPALCKFKQNLIFQYFDWICQAIDAVPTHPFSKTFKNITYKCRPIGNFQPAWHVRPCRFLVAFEHSGHSDSTGRSMCEYDLASTQSHATQIAPVPFPGAH